LNGLQFEWDADKSEANRRKHGVTFEEAATVFRDPTVKSEYDRLHSEGEERWAVIGISEKGRPLAVSYTRRHDALRIISARKANKREARRYAGED